MMIGHRLWIDLLNAQSGWLTDESMLQVIPEEAREFDSTPRWGRNQALAYLSNNAGALRLNYQRLEAGELLDTELLNAVLDTVRLRVMDWRQRGDYDALVADRRRRGDRLLFFQPSLVTEGWNRGTAHIRHLVQRATYHFARYVDQRLGDPRYPGGTSGMFRVLICGGDACEALVACPGGEPDFCSDPCREKTGRLE
jgi:hypothetical protein